MSDKLLPCPFCGGEPRFMRLGTPRLSCQIECTDCNTFHESPDQSERSGTSWNRRSPPATPHGEREG